MTIEVAALITAVLLCWIALVHLALAVGWRRGELVWTGRYPRLLPSELRVRSGLMALLVVVSAGVIVEAGEVVDSGLISDTYMQSATFAVMASLGVYFFYSVFWGTTWERMLFAPISLAGALVAGWLTFA